jgi:uncharacterized integral membrane protein
LLRKKRDAKDILLGRVKSYWEEAPYIIHPERAEKMRSFLARAQQQAEAGELQQAIDSFCQAKREMILARKARQIFYWRSWSGMLLALFLLLLFSLVVALTLFGKPFDEPLRLMFLAFLGGGLGGCVAVLLQAIDVDPESETVSKRLWYFVKPILGAVLGFITYIAVDLTIGILANKAQVASQGGAIVVGFLAGFFESFSKGVLARIAGQYSPSESEKDLRKEE